MSFDGVTRCTVSSVVSSLALREGTLDFVASALQNGLCRFQSCEVDNTESVKRRREKNSILSSGILSSSKRA